jgi:hypothetical protein
MLGAGDGGVVCTSRAIAALVFGTFVHNAANIVFVWLELQTREKFFEKSLARGGLNQRLER